MNGLSDEDSLLVCEIENVVLSAVYTAYSLSCNEPIGKDKFREKYLENGCSFHDLIFGSNSN